MPDAVVLRVREAFGHMDHQTSQWVNATVAEIEAALKAYVKSQVINRETTREAELKRAQTSQEVW